jgi:hypothetical protein
MHYAGVRPEEAITLRRSDIILSAAGLEVLAPLRSAPGDPSSS